MKEDWLIAYQRRDRRLKRYMFLIATIAGLVALYTIVESIHTAGYNSGFQKARSIYEPRIERMEKDWKQCVKDLGVFMRKKKED